jgi:ADP-ribose pyrophosphatase YjhB (NUDIX family)
MSDFWRGIHDWCQATTTNATLAEPGDLVGLDAEDLAGRRALADLIHERGFDHEQIVTRDHPAHATGSALVVSRRGVLLHFHKKFERWLQPGGHIELDELADQCACRETQEETGVPAVHPAEGPTLLSVDDHPAGPHRHLDLLYRLQKRAAAPPQPRSRAGMVRPKHAS